MSTTLVPVALPAGAVGVPVDVDAPLSPRGTVVVAHGAGAGREHPFLVGLARALVAEGFTAVRFDFPYRVAGRRMPGPAAHAVTTWRSVLEWVGEQAFAGPLVAAGKSYGGRMASMAAAERAIDPDGLVYLGYPLHPPGDPSKARAAHLPDVPQRQLFIAGTDDPFIDPHAQLVDAVTGCREASVHWIEGGGHSFEVKGNRRPADEIGASLAPVIAVFADALI